MKYKTMGKIYYSIVKLRTVTNQRKETYVSKNFLGESRKASKIPWMT